MIWTILIGAAAGFLAGQILRGRGYGAIGNIVLGIFGGFVGGFLFGLIGLGPSNLIGELLAAVVGSVLLVTLFGSAHNRRHRD